LLHSLLGSFFALVRTTIHGQGPLCNANSLGAVAAASERSRQVDLDQAFANGSGEDSSDLLEKQLSLARRSARVLRKDWAWEPSPSACCSRSRWNLHPTRSSKPGSRVYLARLSDAAGDRARLLTYKEALAVDVGSAKAKEAAEKGMQQSFQK